MSEQSDAPGWVTGLGFILALGMMAAYGWWVTYQWAYQQHGLGLAVLSVIVGFPVLGTVGPLLTMAVLGPVLAVREHRKATP